MKLYHYTCSHSEPDIRREGRLLPWSQPLLDGLHLIWLTDMAWPDRQGLGLTSVTLQCDRAQWRVTVDADAQRWVDFARTLPTKLRPACRALDFAPGALPMHWWVSEVALPVLSMGRTADPLAVCEFCGRQTADPTALCPNPSCQALTSERDQVLAGLVEKELDDE